MVKRNYGIDLLRIVSMLMIVTLHVLIRGGILESNSAFSVKHGISYAIVILCYCSVNCYALISGYVGFGRKFKLGNIVQLWFEVVFYLLVISLVFKFISPDSVDKMQLITSFFPVLFGGKLLSDDMFGLLEGCSPLWLAILYIIGAFCKKYRVSETIKASACVILYFSCILLTLLSKLFIDYAAQRIEGLNPFNDYLISYTSPTILICGVSSFLLFSKIRIVSPVFIKIISFFASTTFGVYIIHLHPNFWTLLLNKFQTYSNLDLFLFVLAIIGTSLAIWLLCSVVDKIREGIFKAAKIHGISEKIGRMGEKCGERITELFYHAILKK